MLMWCPWCEVVWKDVKVMLWDVKWCINMKCLHICDLSTCEMFIYMVWIVYMNELWMTCMLYTYIFVNICESYPDIEYIWICVDSPREYLKNLGQMHFMISIKPFYLFTIPILVLLCVMFQVCRDSMFYHFVASFS